MTRIEGNTTTDSLHELEQTFREAEQTGLRLAIRGRIVALVMIGIFLSASRVDESLDKSIEYALVTGGFVVLGAMHYVLIGSRFDHPWLKYAFVSVDIAIVSALVATQPLYASADLPQVMIFRNSYFLYYFVILGVAAFSFSPGMMLWTGIAGIAGWIGAFRWSIRGMPETLNWNDIGSNPSADEVASVLLNVNFIGTGNRIEESLVLLVVAVLIAVVMARARRTVRRQLELDQERHAITEVFGQYVPRAIADALIRDRGALQPVERTATILFADIAGFTAMTEVAGAQKIVRVLNAYFDDVTRIVSEHDGVITQFQGDAILASFNIPVEDREHAARAIEAARGIQTLLQTRTFDSIPVRARIGICTGPVVAGSIGGGGRQNYTVHGDTVNLAARLESLNKEYDTNLLVAESTLKLVAENKTGMAFRQVGEISVRGLSRSVAIYTPA